MTKHRVSFAIWRSGYQSMLSYLETDDDYNTLYSLTYPITHTEAVNMSDWATNRARYHDAQPLFDAFGWTVFLDALDVVNPDTMYRPTYKTHRRDGSEAVKYAELVQLPHTVHYHSVE